MECADWVAQWNLEATKATTSLFVQGVFPEIGGMKKSREVRSGVERLWIQTFHCSELDKVPIVSSCEGGDCLWGTDWCDDLASDSVGLQQCHNLSEDSSNSSREDSEIFEGCQRLHC